MHLLYGEGAQYRKKQIVKNIIIRNRDGFDPFSKIFT